MNLFFILSNNFTSRAANLSFLLIYILRVFFGDKALFGDKTGNGGRVILFETSSPPSIFISSPPS